MQRSLTARRCSAPSVAAPSPVAAPRLVGTVALPVRRTGAVIAQADVKQGREYREADNAISQPTSKDAAAAQNDALYADEVAAQRASAPKPKPNLSPEMKKKLKEEYIGLGGTENKAMGGNYFLYIIVIVSVLAVLTKLTGAI